VSRPLPGRKRSQDLSSVIRCFAPVCGVNLKNT
jgi:hypothetical protein